MFKKFKKTYKLGGRTINDKIESIIGPSAKIEGNFKSNSNVIVAGEIIGKFVTTQALRVEEGARISADIEAREAIIAGEINGNVTLEGLLNISSSAKIQGDIKVGSISVQQGACIDGKCTVGSNDKKQE